MSSVHCCPHQDLDEFLVPYQHATLPALLDSVAKEDTAAFNLRNVFFYLYWDNSTDKVEELLEREELEDSPGYLRYNSNWSDTRREKISVLRSHGW